MGGGHLPGGLQAPGTVLVGLRREAVSCSLLVASAEQCYEGT